VKINISFTQTDKGDSLRDARYNRIPQAVLFGCFSLQACQGSSMRKAAAMMQECGALQAEGKRGRIETKKNRAEPLNRPFNYGSTLRIRLTLCRFSRSEWSLYGPWGKQLQLASLHPR
jgi:hypothetical protein